MFEVTKHVVTPRFRRSYRSDRSYFARSRVYVFVDNESIIENLQNRRNRPHRLYKEVILSLYPELEWKLKWSQTAGCGCGCSPGFIIDGDRKCIDGIPVDIHIVAKF